jgi:hypothetical protein
MLSVFETFNERLKWLVDEVRKEVKVSNAKIAKALDIDDSYLSMLKRGLKPPPPMDADIWSSPFMRHGAISVEWLRDGKGESKFNIDNVRKSLSETMLLTERYSKQPSPELECREYLGRFLETCKGDPARLGWTLIELQKHFPLNMWPEEGGTIPGVSSAEVSEGARAGAVVAGRKFQRAGGSGRSREVGDASGKKV